MLSRVPFVSGALTSTSDTYLEMTAAIAVPSGHNTPSLAAVPRNSWVRGCASSDRGRMTPAIDVPPPIPTNLMACLRVHFDMVFFLGLKSVRALMPPAGIVIAAASIRISHLVLH